MKYYVIDAFTDTHFKGNPAGVCLLDKEIPEKLMQLIATENNLPETAFLINRGDIFDLRWFTPDVEIDLCGHATLAASYVIFHFVNPRLQQVRFQTQSGLLTVTRHDETFIMDFPSRMPKPIQPHPLLAMAFNCCVLETHLSRDLIAVVENESAVQNLTLNMNLLASLNPDISFGVIVTAKGDSCDFVSRFFAPNAAIKEDPVTGSAHSSLIPFWKNRLNKTIMTAKQLSPRSGILYCEDAGQRVRIGGKAICYMTGDLLI